MAVMMTESKPVNLSMRGTSSPQADAHPLVEFLDRSIRRERRLEALLRRSSRGPWSEGDREQLGFESYENREHARILRRHRADVVRDLGLAGGSPGARVAKVGRTTIPGNALAEAIHLTAVSVEEYDMVAPEIRERFLGKFVQVLAKAQKDGLDRLRAVSARIGVRVAAYSMTRNPAAPRASSPPVRATAAGAA